jgi:hypothetical protein
MALAFGSILGWTIPAWATDEAATISFQEQMALDQQKRQILGGKQDPLGNRPHGETVDFRWKDTAVKRQFGGTCSTFGLVAAMENLLGGSIDLSERHGWSMYAQYSSRKALETFSRRGVVEEQYWPIQDVCAKPNIQESPRYRLGRFRAHGAQVSAALDSLDRGIPIYMAFTTPKEMRACRTVTSPNFKILRNRWGIKSAHAVAVVGYRIDRSIQGGGYFLVKNSWGDSCGDGGYQWYPFQGCWRRNTYCTLWSIDEVEIDSSKAPTDAL